MHRIERFGKWGDAIMARLKAANWWLWAFFASLGFTLVAVAENEYTGFVRRRLAPLADLLAAFVSAPMWKGGIVLVVLVAGLVIIGFWETRPRTIKSPPLSPEDHVEIERVRELWKADDVQVACSNLASLLLHAAEFYGDKGDPFADLLHEPVGALQRAVKVV